VATVREASSWQCLGIEIDEAMVSMGYGKQLLRKQRLTSNDEWTHQAGVRRIKAEPGLV
jgi:hypothetical protein